MEQTTRPVRFEMLAMWSFRETICQTLVKRGGTGITTYLEYGKTAMMGDSGKCGAEKREVSMGMDRPCCKYLVVLENGLFKIKNQPLSSLLCSVLASC